LSLTAIEPAQCNSKHRPRVPARGQVLREKKGKADALRARFEAKQAAKEAGKPKRAKPKVHDKVHDSDDDYDEEGDGGGVGAPGALSKFLRDPITGKVKSPDSTCPFSRCPCFFCMCILFNADKSHPRLTPPLSLSLWHTHRRAQVRLKSAALVVQMGLVAFAKPPAQKAKREIKALQSAAHKQALKKLLFGWATVQLAFRVAATDAFTWPVMIHRSSSHNKPPQHLPR
jgi:hypothetical protein